VTGLMSPGSGSVNTFVLSFLSLSPSGLAGIARGRRNFRLPRFFPGH
jgi:hypothetical protein